MHQGNNDTRERKKIPAQELMLAKYIISSKWVDKDIIKKALQELKKKLSEGESVQLIQILAKKHLIPSEHLPTIFAKMQSITITCPFCGGSEISEAEDGVEIECLKCRKSFKPSIQGLGQSILTGKTGGTDTHKDKISLTCQNNSFDKTVQLSSNNDDRTVVVDKPPHAHSRDKTLPEEESLTDSTEDKKPKKIGPYIVLKELGRGGMGVVYLVRHATLGKEFALKMILNQEFQNPGVAKRFLREATVMARLEHPNLVRVYNVENYEGTLGLAMEYIPGITLLEQVKNKRMKIDETIDLFIKICEALGYVHKEGFVHRDLKPANIIIHPSRGPVVMDFGLAKGINERDDKETMLTRTGQVLGTPHYMSPEQILGHVSKVDQRSDVFSLGVMLYEALCRCLPFQGDTLLKLSQQISTQDPLRPSQINRRVSKDLEVICLKALEKKPDDRYHDAGYLATDLQLLQNDEPIMARPPSFLARLSRKIRRGKKALLLVSSVFLFSIIIALVAFFISKRVDIESSLIQAEKHIEDKQYKEAAQIYENIISLISDKNDPNWRKAVAGKCKILMIEAENILDPLKENTVAEFSKERIEEAYKRYKNAFKKYDEIWNFEVNRDERFYQSLFNLYSMFFSFGREVINITDPRLADVKIFWLNKMEDIELDTRRFNPPDKYKYEFEGRGSLEINTEPDKAEIFLDFLPKDSIKEKINFVKKGETPTKIEALEKAKYYVIRVQKKGYAETVCPFILWERWQKLKLSLKLHKTDELNKDMVYVPFPDIEVFKKFIKHYWKENKDYISGFFIDKYEVTNRRYKNFLDNLPTKKDKLNYLPIKGWDKENFQFPPGKEDYPVTNISYDSALKFAEWEKKTLPTKDEWLLASGYIDKDNYRFPWGNSTPQGSSNVPLLGGNKTMAKVGSFSNDRSIYGCFDMYGNVCEWTCSFENSKSPEETTCVGTDFEENAKDDFLGVFKNRKKYDPSPLIGFRCVYHVSLGARDARNLIDEIVVKSSLEKYGLREILDKAKNLFEQMEYGKAKEIYEEILSKDPNNTIALINLGMTLSVMKRYQEAAEIFERVLKIGDKKFIRIVHILLSINYFLNDNYESSMNSIIPVKEEMRGNWLWYFLHGITSIFLKKRDTALKSMDQFFEMVNRQTEIERVIGTLILEKGKMSGYTGEEEDFFRSKLIEVISYPKEDPARLNINEPFIQNLVPRGDEFFKRYRNALLTQIGDLQPKEMRSVIRVFGGYLSLIGDYKKADEYLKIFTVSIQKETRFEIYILQALIFDNIKNYPESLAKCEEAFKLLPDSASVYLMRGRVYLHQTCYETNNRAELLGRAFQDFKEANRIAPQNYDSLFYMALHAYYRQDYKDSLDWIRKAKSLDSTFPEADFLEGLLLILLKQYNEAEPSINKAVEKNPVYDSFAKLYIRRQAEIQFGQNTYTVDLKGDSEKQMGYAMSLNNQDDQAASLKALVLYYNDDPHTWLKAYLELVILSFKLGKSLEAKILLEKFPNKTIFESKEHRILIATKHLFCKYNDTAKYSKTLRKEDPELVKFFLDQYKRLMEK